MWTNGREDVCRREAKTVIRARAGRRSINSRGAEVERSEVREWRVTQTRRLTAIDRDSARAFRGRPVLIAIRDRLRGAGLRATRPRIGPWRPQAVKWWGGVGVGCGVVVPSERSARP